MLVKGPLGLLYEYRDTIRRRQNENIGLEGRADSKSAPVKNGKQERQKCIPRRLTRSLPHRVSLRELSRVYPAPASAPPCLATIVFEKYSHRV